MLGFAVAVVAAMFGSVPNPPMAMTIYQDSSDAEDGFATVKEQRSLDLQPGEHWIVEEDLPRTLEPYSVNLRPLDAALPFEVLEQNFRYDLISPHSILQASLGQTIYLTQTLPDGSTNTIKGTLLNVPDPPRPVLGELASFPEVLRLFPSLTRQYAPGVVLQTEDGDILVDPPGTLEVPALPPDLLAEPSLNWLIRAKREGPHPYQLSYIVDHIGWDIAYVLTIDETSMRGELLAWVTVTNESGISYKNVAVKLVAGDVQRIRQPNWYESEMNQVLKVAYLLFGQGRGGGAVREQLGDYYLYTFGRNVDLPRNSIKQFQLFEAEGFKVTKEMILPRPGAEEKKLAYTFANTKEEFLGFPLPRGLVRIFWINQSGEKHLLGEADIGNTPRGEDVELFPRVPVFTDETSGRK
jgi:hypothetical protein